MRSSTMRALLLVAITQAPAGCASPERAERGTAMQAESGRRSTIVGIARDGKGGPAVIVDGRPIYVPRLKAWPEGWVGEQVVVNGRIRTRQGLPEGTTDMGGIVGPYQVIEHASWRLAE